jgi:hypothetical protein
MQMKILKAAAETGIALGEVSSKFEALCPSFAARSANRKFNTPRPASCLSR